MPNLLTAAEKVLFDKFGCKPCSIVVNKYSCAMVFYEDDSLADHLARQSMNEKKEKRKSRKKDKKKIKS